jgi:hypothetical protein
MGHSVKGAEVNEGLFGSAENEHFHFDIAATACIQIKNCNNRPRTPIYVLRDLEAYSLLETADIQIRDDVLPILSHRWPI